MKITMIGPVYPYKTGLSYYVGLLYRKLSKQNEVKLYSYSLQYPKFLYKKPQKDYTDEAVKVDNAEYILNSANPFNWVHVAKKINKDSPDLVIFQWLHPYFTPCYWSIIKMLKNVKVLYICHNAVPHERFIFDKKLTKLALKNADYIIAHSNSDAEILKDMLPSSQIKVNPHPAYNFFKIKDMSQSEARKILKIKSDGKVLLFFGIIREYKGLKYLLKAMPRIAEKIPDIKLLIAGDFSEDKQTYFDLIEELKIEDFVNVYPGHLPVPEVEKYFAASDLIVLPYESATQSGVIQTAYGFDKPVLATAVGGLPDAVDHMKTGYLVKPRDPEEIAKAVIDYFTNNRCDEFAAHIKENAYRFSWDRMEKCIESFMGK